MALGDERNEMGRLGSKREDRYLHKGYKNAIYDER